MFVSNTRILALMETMMRRFWKATLAALSFTAFVGVAGCASAQPYGYDSYGPGYDDNYADGYGYNQPPGGVPYDYDSGGYCDEWGCPDDYYDLPVYYGSVYYGGSWFNGPLYYRDWGGGRQFWVHGGWHSDGWRGPRPSWYREGRYGPALGRSFYGSNRFGGGYAQQYRGGYNRGFDNRGFNRNDGNASRFGNRSFAPQAQAAPQAQQRFGGQRFGNPSGQRQNVQRSDAGRADRGQHNAAPRGGGDRGDHGGHSR